MIRIEQGKNLSTMNTFGMKVSCACFVEYDSINDLNEIFGTLIHKLPQPMFHIGRGSNLLFTKDFQGTVLHSNLRFIAVCGKDSGYKSEHAANPCPDNAQQVPVEVGAGIIFDDFCEWASQQNLWGTENLSLIPGEVGAAAVQNIGAYGVEAKDIIAAVNCFDMATCKTATLDVKECRYAYRDSIFKNAAKGRYIVTSVVFRLSREKTPQLGYGHIHTAIEEALGCPIDKAGEKLTPALIRKTIINIRESKLPDPAKIGSAGSFFKNPVVPRSTYSKIVRIASIESGYDCKVPHYDVEPGLVKIPAAWLIEHCGWKGHIDGNAGVYEKQPLVLVNLTGLASPLEIIALEQKIIRSVKEKYGIELHPEVEHL